MPVPSGGYVYYQRTRAGRRYRSHCRRRALPGSQEEVLLDENELAAGQDYFLLGAFSVSPDRRHLAYAVYTTGDERRARRAVMVFSALTLTGIIITAWKIE